MKCELLIYIGPSRHDRPFDPKFGDVVEIREQGFGWGTEEIKRSLLVTADLTANEQQRLLEPEYTWVDDPNPEPDDPPGQQVAMTLRYRKYGIETKVLPVEIQMALAQQRAIAIDQRDLTKILMSDGKPLSDKKRELTIRPELKALKIG